MASASTLSLSIEAFVKGLKEVRALGSEIKILGQEAGATGRSTEGAGGQLDKFVSEAEKASKSISTLVGYVKAAVVAYTAFAALGSLKDAANLAARNETLGITLGIVGKNAGYGREELQKYEDGLKGLGITTGAARDSMIQMIQAGLKLGPVIEGGTSQINLFARAAQDLAVVTGEGSSETLQRMITNIQQLDTQGLKFMGIVVDLDTANQKFATSVGKSASSLTKMEQQQALANATLEKAQGLMGTYEAALETVGKKLGSMSRYADNAAEAIGKSLLPAFGVLVDSATKFLSKVEKFASAIAASGEVAELLRAAIAAVLVVAERIGDAFVKGFSKLLEAASGTIEKMQVAFDGFSGDAMIVLLEKIIGLVFDLGTFFVEMVGEAAPSFRLLADTLSEVAKMLIDTTTGAFGFADGLNDSITAGKVLGGVLNTASLIIAVVADAFMMVKGVAEVLFGILYTGFGSLTTLIGRIVSAVLPSLGASLTEIGSQWVKMGNASYDAAAKTAEGFKTGETYTTRFLAKLAELPAAHEKIGDAAKKTASESKLAYDEMDNKIIKFTRDVKEHNLTGEQAVKAAQSLGIEVKLTGEKYGFTEKQMAVFNTRLTAGREEATDATEALKTLKISASEFGTGISDAGKRGVTAFNDLAATGKYSSEQLKLAFDKALDFETSIGGLKTFKEALEQTFKDGKISAEDYGVSVKALDEKFNELFDKQLKAAKSQEDLKQLGDEVQRLGGKVVLTESQAALLKATLTTLTGTASMSIAEAVKQIEELGAKGVLSAEKVTTLTNKIKEIGVDGKVSGAEVSKLVDSTVMLDTKGSISADKMTLALGRIAEAATGARESTLRLAEQETARGAANVTMAQNELALIQAVNAEAKAKSAVTEAENNFKRTGSELDKAILADARANLAVAQAKTELQRSQNAEAIASIDVLIAKQDELNAKKELERTGNTSANLAAVDAAKKDVESRQLSLEAATQTTQQAQLNVIATQANAEATGKVVAGLTDAEAKLKSMEGSSYNIATQLSDVTNAMSEVMGQVLSGAKTLRDVGFTAAEAAERQESAHRNSLAASAGISGMWANAANAAGQIQTAAKDFTAQMAKAKDFEASFEATKASAENIAANMGGLPSAAQAHWTISKNIDAVYARVADSAMSVARSAQDAVTSFNKSSNSIREELLRAKGLEEEVAKSRFESRMNDLRLEKTLLDIKLAAAEMTARAAGINTSAIKQMQKDANDIFEDSKRYLLELQDIELKGIKKAKDAREKDDADKKLKDTKDAATAAVTAKTAISAAQASAASATSTYNTSTAAQRAAAGMTAPPKTVNVNLTVAGSTTQVTVLASEEASLMSTLSRLKTTA